MYKKNLILLLLIFIPTLMFGQFAETIRTGRPGQSIGAFTLGSNVFQVQSGINYNAFEAAEGVERSNFLFSNVFRLGIWEKFEVSAVANYSIADEDPLTNNRIRGISNTQIGARYNILKPNGAIPALGIQGRLLLKIQRKEFRREKLDSRFILAAGNRITDWVSYTTNLGLVWQGDGEGPVEFYTFALGFSLSDRIGSFVEVYGILDGFTTNYDAGFSYLVHEDLKLDVSAGWQGANNRDNWFADAGFSWRFDWRD